MPDAPNAVGRSPAVPRAATRPVAEPSPRADEERFDRQVPERPSASASRAAGTCPRSRPRSRSPGTYVSRGDGGAGDHLDDERGQRGGEVAPPALLPGRDERSRPSVVHERCPRPHEARAGGRCTRRSDGPARRRGTRTARRPAARSGRARRGIRAERRPRHVAQPAHRDGSRSAEETHASTVGDDL